MRIANIVRTSSILVAFLTAILSHPAHAGPIVVGHDINTLGTFVAGSQEEAFAVNVANYLTADSATKNLLLFESNPGDGTRDYSTGVLNALGNAGFTVTVTSDYSTAFDMFDAIFVAQDFPGAGFLDNNAMIDYVNDSGGIYLAGGVGPSPSVEAGGWQTFLNSFGLDFVSTNYNGINNVPITSAHPIFDGITSLGSGNGQSIINLGTNPNAQIVQSFQNQGMYAVVDMPPIIVPVGEPPILLLFAGGIASLMVMANRRRRPTECRPIN